MRFVLFVLLASLSLPCLAGRQKEEPLSNSVRAMLHKSVSDSASPRLMFASEKEAISAFGNRPDRTAFAPE